MATNDPTNIDTTGYYKCADCHLFVDVNPAYEDDPDPYAPWMHLMGECLFCVATDESHEPQPDIQIGAQNIEYWKENGPALMRARFTDTDIPPLPLYTIVTLLPLDFGNGRRDDNGNHSIEVLHQFVSLTDDE